MSIAAGVLALASDSILFVLPAPAAVRPPGQRIALARDAAFSFIYPHLVQGWRGLGPRSSPSRRSPTSRRLPIATSAGFRAAIPNCTRGGLAAAARFREGLRRFAETRPVHGECGGYMALGESLIDAAGVAHPMAGLLGVETSLQSAE